MPSFLDRIVAGTTRTRATAAAQFPARVACDTVVFDGDISVIGGQAGSYPDAVSLNDVWFSGDGITWTEVTDGVR